MKNLYLVCISLIILSACVDESAPEEGPAFASCYMNMEAPVPNGGLIGGPCQLAITVDVECPVDADPTFNKLLVIWWANKPEAASDIFETTYRCGETAVLKFGSAVCKGLPIEAVAGFQDPISGVFDGTNGERICADTVVAL